MGMFLRRGEAPPRTQLGDLAVGSTVKINVNGTPWEFLVVHQGLPSSLYDESCNGTWLLMKDIYEKRQWDSSNFNRYESSAIHSYLNSTFLNLFDSNIKDTIKQVTIPYYKKVSDTGGTTQSGAEGLSCKIFLLGGYEVGCAGSTYTPIDGAKLDYFPATTKADSKRIAHLNGSVDYWWLRSPVTNNAYYACYINSSGALRNDNLYNSNGIRPAFTLPSTTIVGDDMLIA